MASFIKIKCVGSLNSFRLPDFHTYHKTLPLPPKPTVAGMLGSAAGLSPEEVNDRLLKGNRQFAVGVVGRSFGRTNDLWQIRKYENKTIAAYKKGDVDKPYKTSVIVRELLYGSVISLYLSFTDESERAFFFEKLNHPEWAVSLGREDELVRITALEQIECDTVPQAFFSNTILPARRFELDARSIRQSAGINLLAKAPTVVNLPAEFTYSNGTREATRFESYVFVDEFPVRPHNDAVNYYDATEDVYFQLI